MIVKSSSGDDAKPAWLEMARAGKCPSCGAPVELGVSCCWRCGTKLR
ncbi:MAG: hypothetical protein LM590_16355 [Thermofilum sp.]|nr:hypothetical protein [Thermofilum sp.]